MLDLPPIAITIAYIVIIYYKNFFGKAFTESLNWIILKFKKHIPNYPNINSNYEWKKLLFYTRIKIENPLLDVVLPALLIGSFYFSLICILHFHLSPTGLDFIEKITSIIFNPVSEEILTRGILFGYLFMYLIPVKLNLDKAKTPVRYYAIILLGALFSSIAFLRPHDQINSIRIIFTLMATFLYYITKGNLMAPIVLHIINNTISNTLTYCPF